MKREWLSRAGRLSKNVALAVTLLVIFGAPLAVGTVHSNTIWPVTVFVATGLLAVATYRAAKGSTPRGALYTWPLSLLVALPLLQTIPLPLGLRGFIDPRGVELLASTTLTALNSFPLSLDPASTQTEILRAALALSVFLTCLNLSFGPRGKGPWIVAAIATSSVCGVVIALAHSILEIDGLYGRFFVNGSSPHLGPFINPNHTAQFFELGAFAAVACLFTSNDKVGKAGWMVAALLCGAAALLTLSRASLLGLCAGAIVLLALWPRDVNDPSKSLGRWHVGFLLMLGGGVVLTAGLAVALGALPILDELSRTQILAPGEKTDVWIDSLSVLWAHPAGIGRGAFDHLYPVYRTLQGSIQQTFIENVPLQLLVDLGWIGLGALLVSTIYVYRAWNQRRCLDGTEAALLAALAAVFAHNLFDFGLETLGIRLPIAAAAGVIVGRAQLSRSQPDSREAWSWVPVALAVIGILWGALGLARVKSYDQLISAAKDPVRRKLLAIEASRAHPVDYFYPLQQALVEPLLVVGTSPRLSALTRAMRLCPRCSNVHHAIAESLWRLGKRSQSLMEYRIAIDVDPDSASALVNELYSLGAVHKNVAELAPASAQASLTVARALVARQATGMPPRYALQHAKKAGAPADELGSLWVELFLTENNLQEANAAVSSLLKANSRAARAVYLHSVVLQKRGEKAQALRVAVQGSDLNPDDAPLARQRVYLATELADWDEVERGIGALRAALVAAGATGAEAYLLSAETNLRRSNVPRAIRDYQTVTNLEPNNVSPWLALGATAEGAGFYTQAVDAFRAALRLDPNRTEAKEGLARIEKVRQRTRLENAVEAVP